MAVLIIAIATSHCLSDNRVGPDINLYTDCVMFLKVATKSNLLNAIKIVLVQFTSK